MWHAVVARSCEGPRSGQACAAWLVASGADVAARDLSGAQALTHAARGKLADGGAVRPPRKPYGLATERYAFSNT